MSGLRHLVRGGADVPHPPLCGAEVRLSAARGRWVVKIVQRGEHSAYARQPCLACHILAECMADTEWRELHWADAEDDGLNTI